MLCGASICLLTLGPPCPLQSGWTELQVHLGRHRERPPRIQEISGSLHCGCHVTQPSQRVTRQPTPDGGLPAISVRLTSTGFRGPHRLAHGSAVQGSSSRPPQSCAQSPWIVLEITADAPTLRTRARPLRNAPERVVLTAGWWWQRCWSHPRHSPS